MTSNQKFLTGTILMIATALSATRIPSIIRQNPQFNRSWALLLVAACLTGFVIQLIAFAEKLSYWKIPPKR